MNFDITYNIIIPFLLKPFADMTHSYGWAIIFLTIVVRALVAPLVFASTTAMQRMSQLQPQLKQIQDRYKGEPEMFQKKAMEFYSKNKVNPMSGCWPTLIQLPVLFALFATFTGPPFADRPIDVTVHVVDKSEAQVQHQEVSKNTSPYIGPNGKLAKLAIFPGDSSVLVGDAIDFGIRPIDGTLLPDFKNGWKIIGPAKDQSELSQKATIDATGHAVFLKTGEYRVQAIIPGVAKHEKFLFINGLGKVAQGAALLKPENWDSLSLILLFGITMYLSQKFTVAPPKKVPGQQLDEQQIIQQQTMKTMPIAVTVMFFFIPLPTGVYLYMVISNVIQSFQTWMIMKRPAPQLVDVLADVGPVNSNGSGAGGKPQQTEAKRIAQEVSTSKKRSKKKKKK